jgi:hypothetical protein
MLKMYPINRTCRFIHPRHESTDDNISDAVSRIRNLLLFLSKSLHCRVSFDIFKVGSIYYIFSIFIRDDEVSKWGPAYKIVDTELFK